MSILSVHSILFVYFLCVGLCSSKSLILTADEKLNQELQKLSDSSYKSYLLYSIPAASAGKNLFKWSDSLSEDCVRTAKAFLQSAAKPSVSQQALYVLHESCAEAVKDKSNGFFQKQVETTCKRINEETKKLPFDFANFEELKKKADIPKPATNYIFEVPAHRSFNNWINSVDMNFDDADMFKYEIIVQFQALTIPAVSDKNRLDLVATVRAIDQLSRRPLYKSTVDSVFVQALEDYTNEILPQKIDKYSATRPSAFSKKVDQYFLKHSVLTEEYKKTKNQIIEELRRVNSKQ